MTEIDYIVQYFDIWNDKPLNVVLCQLQAKGYKMKDIRKAYYQWCEEK